MENNALLNSFYRFPHFILQHVLSFSTCHSTPMFFSLVYAFTEVTVSGKADQVLNTILKLLAVDEAALPVTLIVT